jgi:hypothetical protein
LRAYQPSNLVCHNICVWSTGCVPIGHWFKSGYRWREDTGFWALSGHLPGWTLGSWERGCSIVAIRLGLHWLLKVKERFHPQVYVKEFRNGSSIMNNHPWEVAIDHGREPPYKLARYFDLFQAYGASSTCFQRGLLEVLSPTEAYHRYLSGTSSRNHIFPTLSPGWSVRWKSQFHRMEQFRGFHQLPSPLCRNGVVWHGVGLRTLRIRGALRYPWSSPGPPV